MKTDDCVLLQQDSFKVTHTLACLDVGVKALEQVCWCKIEKADCLQVHVLARGILCSSVHTQHVLWVP